MTSSCFHFWCGCKMHTYNFWFWMGLLLFYTSHIYLPCSNAASEHRTLQLRYVTLSCSCMNLCSEVRLQREYSDRNPLSISWLYNFFPQMHSWASVCQVWRLYFMTHGGCLDSCFIPIVKQGSEGRLCSTCWLLEAHTWWTSSGISQIHAEYTSFTPPSIWWEGLLWFESA
jgi:hypothetical protein